jgi:hypothetical protein
MRLGRQKSKIRTRKLQTNRLSLLYYTGKPKSSQTVIDGNKKGEPRTNKNPLQLVVNALIILVSLMGLGYGLTLSTAPKIEFQSKSELLGDISYYESSVSSILKSSIFNRSKPTINTSSVSKAIEERHPEIASATIVVPFLFRQPKVIITPITPAFIENSGNNSYLVDQFGVASARLQDVKNINKLQLVTVNDDAGIDIQQWKAVFTQEQTDFIREVIEQLRSKNIPIASIGIPVSAYDLNVRLKDKPYTIKMNMIGDARSQVGRFLAAEKEAAKSGRGVNEYIDVRVEERAYIK